MLASLGADLASFAPESSRVRMAPQAAESTPPDLPEKDHSSTSTRSSTRPSPSSKTSPKSQQWSSAMIYIPAAILAVGSTVLLQNHFRPSSLVARAWSDGDIPAQAQRIYPSSFAVLDSVPPPTQADLNTVRREQCNVTLTSPDRHSPRVLVG